MTAPSGNLTEPRLTVEMRPYHVTIDTSLGRVSMVANPRLATRAVNNFLYLARQGFYDGLEVFRVIPHFIAQAGSPTNNAAGGAGFTFPGELPRGYRYRTGDVAMASTLEERGCSSQFFICLGDAELEPDYPLLGRITGDDALLHALNSAQIVPDDRPRTPIVIRHVAVAE